MKHLLFILALFMIISCKTEEVVSPCQLVTYSTNDPSPITSTFFYNSDAKLVKIIESPSNNYTTINYTKTSIEFITYDKTASETSYIKYNIDANGRASSSTNRAGVITTYDYDGDGYLIKITNNGNISNTYTIKDGNRIKRTIYSTSGSITATISYDFDLTQLAKDPDITGKASLLGKNSKNSLIRSTTSSVSAGTKITEYADVYTYDNKGNATQIISTTTNIGNPQISTIATKKYGYSYL